VDGSVFELAVVSKIEGISFIQLYQENAISKKPLFCTMAFLFVFLLKEGAFVFSK